MSQSSTESAPELVVWDFQRLLRRVDASQAHFSRGFLQCHPEKWFPGIAAEWLPLTHSLSLELRVSEIKPVLRLPEGLEVGYGGAINGEPFGLFFDRDLVRQILEVVIPGALPESRDIILEYVARRFVTTLAKSWGGGDSSEVQYDQRIDPFSCPYVGAVKLGIVVNGVSASIWIGLGRNIIERLDGLWRRQVQSTGKTSEGSVEIFLEVAQLAVPPADILTYTRSGTVIDLEVPAVDTVTVKSAQKLLFQSQMVNVEGRLGLETLSTPPPQQVLPEGMTRIGIVFGKFSVDSAILSENSQFGSLWDTGVLLSDSVQMILNGDVVATGTLCTYDGRFALSVN